MDNYSTTNGIDIIGDVHGHCDILCSLLRKLGYRKDIAGTYLHPSNRQAVFVGDLLNKGSKIRETLQVVKAMTEANSALAIIGNHEFNLLGMETNGEDGSPLRAHTKEHLAEVSETKAAYRDTPEELEVCLKWIRSLPLSLELSGLRVVHAAWHRKSLKVIAGRNFENNSFLREAFDKSSPVHEAVNITLKGIKIPLPKDKVYRDRFGIPRTKARTRWWMNPRGKSYSELLFPPSANAPKDKKPKASSLASFEVYSPEDPPVFFGHYCLAPTVPKIHGNVVCVDGCVTCDGKLWAYQFDGEKRPSFKKLVSAS